MRALLRLLIVFVLAAPSLAPRQTSCQPRPHAPELAIPAAIAHVAAGERPALRLSTAPAVLTFREHAPDETHIAVITSAPRLRQTDAHPTDRGRAPPHASLL